MSLRLLEEDLQRYAAFWPAGRAYDRYLRFVRSTPDCCLRTHLEGHCTGSAFVVSPGMDQVLLLFHPFLKRWLQPGGHADGSPDLMEVALRETHEETGLPRQALVPANLNGQARTPLDLDIHPIPARKSEPAHEHFDLRFLLHADPSIPVRGESSAMKVEWVPLEKVESRTGEESVLRMVRKVATLRAGSLR